MQEGTDIKKNEGRKEREMKIQEYEDIIEK